MKNSKLKIKNQAKFSRVTGIKFATQQIFKDLRLNKESVAAEEELTGIDRETFRASNFVNEEMSLSKNKTSINDNFNSLMGTNVTTNFEHLPEGV